MAIVKITLSNGAVITEDSEYYHNNGKLTGAKKRHGFNLIDVTDIDLIFETVVECQENDLQNIKEHGESDNRKYA